MPQQIVGFVTNGLTFRHATTVPSNNNKNCTNPERVIIDSGKKMTIWNTKCELTDGLMGRCWLELSYLPTGFCNFLVFGFVTLLSPWGVPKYINESTGRGPRVVGKTTFDPMQRDRAGATELGINSRWQKCFPGGLRIFFFFFIPHWRMGCVSTKRGFY